MKGILNHLGPQLPHVEEEVADTIIVLVLMKDEELDVCSRWGQGVRDGLRFSWMLATDYLGPETQTSSIR